jgi:hypothetical protein
MADQKPAGGLTIRMSIELAVVLSFAAGGAVTYDRVSKLDALKIETRLALIDARLALLGAKNGIPPDRANIMAEIDAAHKAVQLLRPPE